MDKNIESFCPSDQQDWRNWLTENHLKKDAVWLIIYKKGSSRPNLSWSEAVDEALCFGWIDSTKRSIDLEKYTQYFCKRKASSTWSKINKDKIKTLKRSGLMTEAGLKSIEIAKENGSWTILDTVDNLEIPEDLDKAFSQWPGSKDYFSDLSIQVQKAMLYWIITAKRAETRQKRIHEVAVNAGKNKKPKQFD